MKTKAPPLDKGRGQRGGNVNMVGGWTPLQAGHSKRPDG